MSSQSWKRISDKITPYCFTNNHAIAYESSLSHTTNSSFDHFYEFPRWLLTRALTVFGNCVRPPPSPGKKEIPCRYINFQRSSFTRIKTLSTLPIKVNAMINLSIPLTTVASLLRDFGTKTLVSFLNSSRVLYVAKKEAVLQSIER